MGNLFGDDEPVTIKPLASAAQIQKLARHGIFPDDGITRGAAGAILGKLKDKLTPKQLAILANAGENIDSAPIIANFLISVLAARNWRRRQYLIEHNRFFLRHTEKGIQVVFRDPDAGAVLVGKPYKTDRAARAYVAKIVEWSQPPAPSNSELFQ